MQIGYVQLANVHINDKIYPRVCRRQNKRKIYQIGCNFSSETGTIDGWKLQKTSENYISTLQHQKASWNPYLYMKIPTGFTISIPH